MSLAHGAMLRRSFDIMRGYEKERKTKAALDISLITKPTLEISQKETLDSIEDVLNLFSVISILGPQSFEKFLLPVGYLNNPVFIRVVTFYTRCTELRLQNSAVYNVTHWFLHGRFIAHLKPVIKPKIKGLTNGGTPQWLLLIPASLGDVDTTDVKIAAFFFKQTLPLFCFSNKHFRGKKETSVYQQG